MKCSVGRGGLCLSLGGARQECIPRTQGHPKTGNGSMWPSVGQGTGDEVARLVVVDQTDREDGLTAGGEPRNNRLFVQTSYLGQIKWCGAKCEVTVPVSQVPHL